MVMTVKGEASEWLPSDSEFTATVERSASGNGLKFVLKDSRGNVRVRELLTKERGQIMFREGTPSPKTDGSYAIGEFRPETGGKPWPISILMKTLR